MRKMSSVELMAESMLRAISSTASSQPAHAPAITRFSGQRAEWAQQVAASSWNASLSVAERVGVGDLQMARLYNGKSNVASPPAEARPLWPWEQTPEQRAAASIAAQGQRSTLSRRSCSKEAFEMMTQALAASTADGAMGVNSTGMRAWKAYMARCEEPWRRVMDPMAPLADKLDEELLCMEFVVSLVVERGIAAQTAANYFGQVQGYHLRATGVKLAGGLQMGRLPAMLKGLRRMHGEGQRKLRRGVSARKLRNAMDKCLDPSNPLHANVRAALATAFQGLLRSAEYCDDGKHGTKLEKVLERLPTRGDIVQIDVAKLVLMICPCKNMKHLNGKTVPLVIGTGGAHIDAVREVRNLLQVDPAPQNGPLFRNPATGRPLACDYMRDMIKRLMNAVGEEPSEFGTHSLRIGGATAMFAAGATPTVIRTMGRWSSDCYRLYVRACYEQSMAWTAAAGSTEVTDVQADFDEVDEY